MNLLSSKQKRLKFLSEGLELNNDFDGLSSNENGNTADESILNSANTQQAFSYRPLKFSSANSSFRKRRLMSSRSKI
jgi:hypothetical protein